MLETTQLEFRSDSPWWNRVQADVSALCPKRLLLLDPHLHNAVPSINCFGGLDFVDFVDWL